MGGAGPCGGDCTTCCVSGNRQLVPSVGGRLVASVEVRPLTIEADFAALADQWDALVRAAPRPGPFLLHSWLLEWRRHYGEGAALEVHVAMRGDRLVAALPLCTRRRRALRVTEF